METPGDAPNPPIKDEQESPKWKKPAVVFVLGRPGSGKSSQCAKIVEHFGYTHLSVDDLLGAEISSGSEHGAKIQRFISLGSIVPCEITVNLLCKAMEKSENDKFLIDGFPLNEEHRIGFENLAEIEPAFVLFFDCPEEEVERRILNMNQGRDDDNTETIKKRFKDFVDSTLPIVSYYEPKGKLRKIDAAKPIEDVFEAVKHLFASDTAKLSQEVSGAVKRLFASETPQQSRKRRKLIDFTIPNDISTEIFTRLPAKCAVRCQTLSTLWRTTIGGLEFTNQFLAKSKDRPRLLFAVERHNTWSFFSAPQSPNSRVVAADSHSKFSTDVSRFICGYASGLIYFPHMWIPKEGRYSRPVICNPITGKYAILPELTTYPESRGFLGFDPIHKRFKVLAEKHQQILTLDGVLSWGEKIACPTNDPCLSEGICIDGVIYYLASGGVPGLPPVIVSFDLKTEKFMCIPAGCFPNPANTKLVNYKGSLAGIWWDYVRDDEGKIKFNLSMCIWKEMTWSTVSYGLSRDIFDRCNFSVAGMTIRGELLLAMDYTCNPYRVIYFDLDKKTLREVEIRGFGAKLEEVHTRGRIHVFVNHMDDLHIDYANKLI